MGYLYRGNELVCMTCGCAGARKVKCPYNYCPPIAICSECRKVHKKELKQAHIDNKCKENHEAFVEKQNLEKKLIEQGIPVRCAAMGVDGKVMVLFKLKTGTVGFYMAHATYDAIPLDAVATPDDYRKIGELTEAPSNF